MANELPLTIGDVEEASRAIDGAVLRTPTVESPRLSDLTGARIFVKYENLQATGAFKERGGRNKLMSLSRKECRHGVIAQSAGNHAQAVAFHARRLAMPATIVMPKTTPFTKVANTEAHGARVVLEGEVLAECHAVVDRLVADEGLTPVHPFDDLKVMAGQGTVALEMLADEPDLDCLVVPIGGGGLVSGIAVAAKAMKPGIDVVGAEAAQYASMSALLAGNEPDCGGDTLAEGIAVKSPSPMAVEIVRELVSHVAVVGEEQIERAIYAYLTLQKTTAEGAGAAGLAAVMADPERFADRKVGLVLCGGNIDPRMLSAIAVRALERESTIVSFRRHPARPTRCPGASVDAAWPRRSQYPRCLAQPRLPQRAGHGGNLRHHHRGARRYPCRAHCRRAQGRGHAGCPVAPRELTNSPRRNATLGVLQPNWHH